MLQSGFSALNSAVNPTPAEAAEHFDTVAVLKSVAGWVWLAGVCGMLLYALISFLRLRHRVRASVLLEKGVFVCDEISDPFILGLIVPKIYLPSGMDEQTRAYVLSHERAHLRRFDFIWKPLGFLLLSVYWFNPLLWLAYILLCRDIELACDEKVVKELDDAGKAAYSEALVHASVSRRMVSACPLAFGETGVKGRVKSVLNYKKPAFWIILVAILACVAVAVCFLTMPKKDKIVTTEIVGTWEFYKSISETCEEDAAVHVMCGYSEDNMILREDGTGSFITLYNDRVTELTFTYTVSGDHLVILITDATHPLDAYYDQTANTLTIPDSAVGEGNRWTDVFIREGSITYPEVHLTVEQLVGEWITDGIAVMKGRPLTLSGTLSLDTNGIASMHLNGDADTKMQIDSTFVPDGSIIRFTPDGKDSSLSYYPWLSEDLLYTLDTSNFLADSAGSVLASYDPQSDTIRFMVYDFGVLTFRRKITAVALSSDRNVTVWYEDWDFENSAPDGPQSVTVPAFPNVTFRQTAGSVEAIENGRTRTLFQGMPVWNVFFADVTGDGKPELCATVYFGSGIVDSHIVVYDYTNKQSYVLWERGTFDYHLYTVDGKLLVGKTPNMGDKQVDSGTIVQQGSALFCRFQSDGSMNPLIRELHESELTGEWLVMEETDSDGNVLYTRSADLWKEYNFREDGTVTYNETVPVSSHYELAFGHPVTYPYQLHDNYVYIAGDDTSGAFRWGSYDRDTRALTLMYNTQDGTVYAKLRRMGEGASEDSALASLRQNVPEYFDLPADKGLEIYVWQMAPDDYSFGVMAGTNLRKENEQLWNLKGVSAEDMRLILTAYDISPEDIEVIPIIKPFSDYAYEIDDAYTARVRNMLFGK